MIPAHAAKDLQFYAGDGFEGTATVKVELATLDGLVMARSETQIKIRRPVTGPVSGPEPPIAAGPVAGTVGLSDTAVVRLLARADLLLDTGDLSTARELYRLAAEAGSAGGALKLAETYDPAELARLGMTRTAADEPTARQWYELALSLGAQQAAERLLQLRQR